MNGLELFISPFFIFIIWNNEIFDSMSYKQVLCVLLSLSTALNTFAYDFMVDGLAYNVLSTDDKTVELTNTGDPTNNYSGLTQADIPSAVTNNDITYTVIRIGDYALYYANPWQGGLHSITLPVPLGK